MFTRLAPSPTGALHLGNARTFLITWLLARQQSGRILLRIEDLDGPRTKSGADQQAIEDLQWLGLDWDEGPVYQSPRADIYRQAIDRLLATGQAYPCVCRRKDVTQAASAPHGQDAGPIYPGTCRGRFGSMEEAERFAGHPAAVRFRVPDISIEWTDQFVGTQRYEVSRELGDFVIQKADGVAAYQLAVVLDDTEANITHVIRGNDLIDSTPRQILLHQALGLADRLPSYCHVPLVTGADGRRLAKRHGDTRLSYYRQQGVSPGRLVALLAKWCGINAGDSATPAELLDRFDLTRVPTNPIIFSTNDDRWLRYPDP
jgi:glutamyl-tRNA synthetase